MKYIEYFSVFECGENVDKDDVYDGKSGKDGGNSDFFRLWGVANVAPDKVKRKKKKNC